MVELEDESDVSVAKVCQLRSIEILKVFAITGNDTRGRAIERADGGRGFGFTGLHDHWNFADDNFRKLVLNAIAWTAKIEIPADGIVTPTPTQAELEANQDYPKPAKRRGKRKKQAGGRP